MLRIALLLIALFQMNIGSSTTIAVEAFANQIPIIKGLSKNPIIRIKITAQDLSSQSYLRQLHCLSNQESISVVEKITVFQTAKDLFENMVEVGSIIPQRNQFVVPINLLLASEPQYLWVSVELKKSLPQHAFYLKCSKLTDEKSQVFPINQVSKKDTWFTGVAVRKAWDDSVHTYRIPGIIKTPNGILIAVYDNRYKSSRDLPGNIDVGMSRSRDNGQTWEPMKVIMDMGAPHENNGIGDPAILYDAQTKKIWVAALWSKGNRSVADSKPGLSPDTTGQFVLTNSSDDGINWSTPLSITASIKNPDWHIFFQGPGSGIQMKNGNLVFAAQYWDEKRIPFSTIVYSEDHGNSWIGKLAGPKSNTTESQVVETSDGNLMLNMRDNRGKYRSVAVSKDMGKSWEEHKTSYNTLQDPVCMGSLIKATMKLKKAKKEILFFSNPNSSTERKDMTIKASLDLGETWLSENQILIDNRKCYGYSSLTKIDEKTIGILYEGVRDLYFVSIPISEILK